MGGVLEEGRDEIGCGVVEMREFSAVGGGGIGDEKCEGVEVERGGEQVQLVDGY